MAMLPLAGAAAGAAGGFGGIGSILSGIGSLVGAFAGGGSSQPPIIMPAQAQPAQIGEAPTAPEVLPASKLVDESAIEADKKKRALLLDRGGQVNTLSTRFTPATAESAEVVRPTLLGA